MRPGLGMDYYWGIVENSYENQIFVFMGRIGRSCCRRLDGFG